jgi:aspartate aminotransferase/aminotransferase
MKDISFSGGIIEILKKASELEKSGKNIIHLEMGRPDFSSPDVAIEAAIASLRKGQVHYSDIAGVEELRVAIADDMKETLGLEYDPYKEIVIGVGSVEGLFVSMVSLLDVGDEIIMLTPCFPAYFDQAYLAGVVPVAVPLKFDNGFKVDPEDIRKKITDRTKMIMINTPNNPTGMVLTIDDIEALCKIAVENDLYVVSDETYSSFLYDGEHISIAKMPGMKERTVVVNTTSKAYSMTGWRIGYMASSPEITKYLHKSHQNITTAPATFAQYGAVAAYREGKPWTDMMVAEFRRRRDLVLRYFDEIEGIDYVTPEGAFYVFACIDGLGMKAVEFCDYILNEAGVSIVPGDAFRVEEGRNFIRIAYSSSYEVLEEAMIRIKSAVKNLKK